MRRYLVLGLIAALFLSLLSSPVFSQSAKELLEKMIDAQGGRKTLEVVKDTMILGTMEMIQYGMKGTMTLYQKEPNKLRIEAEVMGMVVTQAFDGENAWWTNPQTGATEVMSDRMAQDMKKQALGNDSLLNPEKYGIKYEAKGKEKIQDKEYLLLEQTLPDGTKSMIYLDPVTYLVYKTKTKTVDPQSGAEINVETLFGDYQKDDLMVAAHSMTVMHDGAEFMKMTFSKITYNSNIDDSKFIMPK